MKKGLILLILLTIISISCSGSSTSKTTTDTDNITQPDDTTPDTASDKDATTPTDTDTAPDSTPTDKDSTTPDPDKDTPQPDPDTTTPDEDKIPEPTIKPFTCANNVCHDPNTGLDWEEETGTIAGWGTNEYCEQILNEKKFGGFEDWRTPAISELRTLIRGCPGMMTYDNCKFDETCATDSCYEGCGQASCLKNPNEGPGVEGCYWESNLKGKCMAYYSTTKLWNQTMFISFENASMSNGVNTPTHKRCVRGTRTDKP